MQNMLVGRYVALATWAGDPVAGEPLAVPCLTLDVDCVSTRLSGML